MCFLSDCSQKTTGSIARECVWCQHCATLWGWAIWKHKFLSILTVYNNLIFWNNYTNNLISSTTSVILELFHAIAYWTNFEIFLANMWLFVFKMIYLIPNEKLINSRPTWSCVTDFALLGYRIQQFILCVRSINHICASVIRSCWQIARVTTPEYIV